MYNVKIQDTFDGREYDGEFDATDANKAAIEARLFYAHELDTNMRDIEVLSVKRTKAI